MKFQLAAAAALLLFDGVGSAQKLVRTDPATLELQTSAAPHHVTGIALLDPTRDGLPVDPGAVHAFPHSLRINLTGKQRDLIRSATLDRGTAYSAVQRICIGGDTTVDCSEDDASHRLLLPVPDAVDVTATGPVTNRSIHLNLNTTPPECKFPANQVLRPVGGAEAPPNWAVTIGSKESQVTERVDSITFRQVAGTNGIAILLTSQPRNKDKLRVRYTPPELPLLCSIDVKIDNLAAPQATKDDPTAGGDLYAAVTHTRNAAGKEVSNVVNADFFMRYRMWLKPPAASLALAVAPSVTLKAANSTQDSENSLKVSAPLSLFYTPLQTSPLLESTEFPLALNFESGVKSTKADRTSEVIRNGVLTFAPVLYPQDWWLGKTARIRIFPTAGIEGGRNFNNPNPELDGKGIFRFKAGGKAAFPVNRPFLKEIAVEASLEYRQLFEEEARVDTDKIKLAAGTYIGPDGAAVTLPEGTLAADRVFRTGKGARRYWSTSLRLAMTPNLQVVSEYVHGSLPPVFEHVDKWQTGIAFRFNFLGQ